MDPMEYPIDYQNILSAAAVQLRAALSTLHLASRQLVPDADREADPELDRKAARVDRTFYHIMRLAMMLTDVMYLSGERKVVRKGCDAAGLVRDLIIEAADLVEMQGQTFQFSVTPNRHFCLVDPYGIKVILYHLLSNAMKNTPAGGTIRVDFCVKGKRILLTVSDNGAGMTDEQIAAALDGGWRADASHTFYGMGLGLPLCRSIAAGHGGTLVAQSRLGEGTTVVVSLPSEKPEGVWVESPPVDHSGGFNTTLLGLVDALPAEAFLLRGEE